MTKVSFKFVAARAAGVAVAASLLAPSFAAAQRPSPAEERRSVSAENVSESRCEAFIRIADRMLERLEDRKGRLEGKRADKKERMDERIARRETRHEERRGRWEDRRESLYDRLDELADSDEKKAAVNAFKRAVDDAVSERRDAVKAANDAYQEGLRALLDRRSEAVENAKDVYHEAVKNAVQNAKEACDGDADAKVVREDLRAALAAAKDAFQRARKEIDGMADELHALIDARKASHETAKEAFVDALEAAKADLRAAIGPEAEDGSATSTEEHEG